MGVKQLALQFPYSWGGSRKGAGRRPRDGRGNVPHRPRSRHRKDWPVLITMRSKWRSLRTQFVFPTVRRAIRSVNSGAVAGFRVCEFSIQGDHIHLLVEAESSRALQRGVKSLAIRIAKRVNRLLFERGRFFIDRYHALALTTPRAVRNALVYVLGNFRKHEPLYAARSVIDCYSSAPYFHGFVEFDEATVRQRAARYVNRLDSQGSAPVETAQTWLLAHGWKRYGLISIREAPRREKS
ncbi:MAG: transposase [Myxococcota bacterium]